MMFPMMNIVPFSAFTWTGAIPQLYYNVFSNEQRIKEICRKLGKAEAYMDYVAKEVNDYSISIGIEVSIELEEAHKELMALREELIELIQQTGEGSLDWNVQRGMYDSSMNAMRDMFNDVTVHALTVAELNAIDSLTVQGLSDSGLNVKGLAVMSRWLVDNNEPLYNPYRYI